MQIQQNHLTPNPYSRQQSSMKMVKGIVVHYVGNAGTPGINNRNYFESLKDKKTIFASSHYIIGLQGEIIQCVPENEVAYHANNANSTHLGIECCHPDASGKFNDKTYASLIALCVDICKRYNLDPRTAVIRHYDVTGKTCPLYYVKNPIEWSVLKARVYDAVMAQKTASTPEKLSKYVQMDYPYWDDVIAGKKPANPEYVRILFERFLAFCERG